MRAHLASLMLFLMLPMCGTIPQQKAATAVLEDVDYLRVETRIDPASLNGRTLDVELVTVALVSGPPIPLERGLLTTIDSVLSIQFAGGSDRLVPLSDIAYVQVDGDWSIERTTSGSTAINWVPVIVGSVLAGVLLAAAVAF